MMQASVNYHQVEGAVVVGQVFGVLAVVRYALIEICDRNVRESRQGNRVRVRRAAAHHENAI